jgi:hypothetical protein
MKKKIVFITNHRARQPGIRARCSYVHPKTKQQCKKPHDHRQGHAYALPNESRPKKSRISTLTKLDCLQMIEDPQYRKRLLIDLRARKLRPAVECMLWYYAKGKPKEMVEHSGTLSLQQELSVLTPEELRQRALDVAAMLSTPMVH